jgi:hypothetical protein
LKCPCENCVCMAICRLKTYPELFLQCTLLLDYEPRYSSKNGRDYRKMYRLQDILKPINWQYKDEDGEALIHTKYMWTLLHNED